MLLGQIKVTFGGSGWWWAPGPSLGSILGCIWGAQGRSWAPLGVPRGGLGSHLGGFGAHFGGSVSSSGSPWVVIYGHFGTLGAYFWNLGNNFLRIFEKKVIFTRTYVFQRFFDVFGVRGVTF